VQSRDAASSKRPHPLHGFELAGYSASAQFLEVRDMVVEGAWGDAQQFGDRGDRAAGVGQELAGGGQALVGADDDQLADELGEGGEDVEDESAAGGWWCPGSRAAR
jgi:hypothetical protein